MLLPMRSRLAAWRHPAPHHAYAPAGALGPFRRGVLLFALLFLGLLLALAASSASAISVDEPMLKAVQGVIPAGFEPVARFFNLFVRDTAIPVLWAASILGFLTLRRNDYAVLFVLTAANGPFTSLLKNWIDRPRPEGDFQILQFPLDPSFPSGHTITAVVFFGLWFAVAGQVLPRRAVLPVRVACVAAVMLTGISRVWVGAHWPSDVAGGLVWGALFVLLLLMTHPFWAGLLAPKTT